MKIAIALVLAVAACSKGDDCQRLFDRMAAMMKDPKVTSAKDKFLDECHKDKKYLEDPTAKCVLAASTDSAAADCMKKGFEDYASKSKATEAALMLNRIGKSAKVVTVSEGAFPKGKAKMLPDVPTCCGG